MSVRSSMKRVDYTVLQLNRFHWLLVTEVVRVGCVIGVEIP